MMHELALRMREGIGLAPGDAVDANVPECRNGELWQVWEEVAPELRRFVAATLLDRSSVDDVLQDVYLAAMKNAVKNQQACLAREWLFRVAVNRCRLEFRRRGVWRRAFERLARGATTVTQDKNGESLEQTGEREAVREAVRGLEFEYRTPLVMRYFLDFDSNEIGKILDLSPSTVRGRLRIARRRLASALAKRGIHE